MTRTDSVDLGVVADFDAVAVHVAELLGATDLTRVEPGGYYGFQYAGAFGNIWGAGGDGGGHVTVPEGLGQGVFDALTVDPSLALELTSDEGELIAARPAAEDGVR